MKRIVYLSAALSCICVLLAFTAPNAGATAVSCAEAFLYPLPGTGSVEADGVVLSIMETNSESFAEVGNDFEYGASMFWAANLSTQAQVEITNVSASALTDTTVVGAQAQAMADGCDNFWADAESQGERWRWVSAVDGSGTVTMSIDYLLSVDLLGENIGDYAAGSAQVEIYAGVYTDADDDVPQNTYFDLDTLFPEIFNIDDAHEEMTGTLRISFPMSAGDYAEIGGYGWVNCMAETATCVPEPVALLLLGTGLVCLVGLKRKFKQ